MQCPCGKALQPSTNGRPARYCSASCRRAARAAQNRAYLQRRGFRQRRVVVGIDSETITENGQTRLVLIVCGKRHIARDNITSRQALDFILDQTGELWSFFGDYDVNFWIRDLPGSCLERLRRTGWTKHGPYRIHHIPRRLFEIWDRKRKRYQAIYDVFPFVQSSYIDWLASWKLADRATIARIARMKGQRKNFAELNRADVLTYTLDEVKYLARGVETLKTRIGGAGFTPSRWLGPGAVAAKALRMHGVQNHLPKRTHPKAEEAYFGGRIETGFVGEVAGPLHYYDIASAYPAAMVDLPCMRHGKWTRGEGNAASLLRVAWKPKNPNKPPAWGPFPRRVHKGVPLRYPSSGCGWYWKDEVEPWRSKSSPFHVKVLQAVQWQQSCNHRPLAWIADLYARRVEMKKAGDPAEYALKLILNSCYGKFAQRVGRHPFQCFEWAGMITARTRARLAAVLIEHGQSVVLVATDGVIATKRLGLTNGGGLGAWEDAGTYPFADVWQPGFYILGDDRDSIRTRGFTRHDVNPKTLRDAWQEAYLMGVAKIPRRRCIGYRLAMHQGKPEMIGKWIEETSDVHFFPPPRREVFYKNPIYSRRGTAFRLYAPGRKIESKKRLQEVAKIYDDHRKHGNYLDDGEQFGVERD